MHVSQSGSGITIGEFGVFQKAEAICTTGRVSYADRLQRGNSADLEIELRYLRTFKSEHCMQN